MTTAIIDGDIVLYPICAAHERETRWGDVHTLHSDWNEVRHVVWNHIDQLQERVEASSLIVAFSDSENFRKTLDPAYKTNRQNRKPLCFSRAIEEIMQEGIGVKYPTLEADDVVGILGTGAYRTDGVMISSDKDLKTVPGLHYNPRQPDLGVYEIGPTEAQWWHMIQTLTGDTTDGYKGCPGIGLAKAPKILEDATEGLWEAVVASYEKAGKTEEDALLQARLAYILQADNWDEHTKEVKLWEPKSAAVRTA